MDVATNMHDLIPKIKRDKKQSEVIQNTMLTSSKICTSTSQKQEKGKSSMEINGDFVFFQTFIETLIRMPSSQSDQKDFLEFLRQKYSTCPLNLEKIDQFEQDKSPLKAIS
ncbi:unnamed protein product, partial [Rotaria sp. Silwood2]